MNARALKHVPHYRIEDHLRQGWMVSIPNAWMHHHVYGAELKWVCECRIPGAKFDRVPHRVPLTTSQEGANERADHRG